MVRRGGGEGIGKGDNKKSRRGVNRKYPKTVTAYNEKQKGEQGQAQTT